jgi:hypothetical protein
MTRLSVDYAGLMRGLRVPLAAVLYTKRNGQRMPRLAQIRMIRASADSRHAHERITGSI